MNTLSAPNSVHPWEDPNALKKFAADLCRNGDLLEAVRTKLHNRAFRPEVWALHLLTLPQVRDALAAELELEHQRLGKLVERKDAR
jgi:hypothetical protein